MGNCCPCLGKKKTDEDIINSQDRELTEKEQHREKYIKGKWDFSQLSAKEIENEMDKLIAELKKMFDSVADIKKDDVGTGNLASVLADIESKVMTDSTPLTMTSQVSSDKAIREAGIEADKKLSKFLVDMSMRKDIFDRVVWFLEGDQYNSLSSEGQRFIDHQVRDGKRNGLHLSIKKRERLSEIQKRLGDLSTDFQSNLNEDKSYLTFKKEELSGMSDKYLNGREKTDDGLYMVDMSYPSYQPVIRNCTLPETRKKCNALFLSRCRDSNRPILAEFIEIRKEQAEIMGYPNHASYIQEIRMAKNPQTVSKFLSDLLEKLKPLYEEEQRDMLAVKKEECSQTGSKDDCDTLNYWDTKYYMTKVEEQKFEVDKEELRKYFPMEVVTEGLLGIYEELLGLKFTEIQNAEVWHQDVKLYKVEDSKSSKVKGFFFLDLYPRDGKFSHAAVYSLQPGCIDSNGERQLPVCAMLCNFTKPTGSSHSLFYIPSLLGHDEVETYFHEFGHVMHNICIEVDYARFGMDGVERDFIEAPSQMLENWVWEEESLRKMSQHYETGKPIPQTMLTNLIASRKANTGYNNLRQVLIASFDQKIHTENVSSLTEEFNHMQKDILGVDAIPGTCFPSHIGHLTESYAASYYGYLWSEVFSMDMFDSQFKRKGIMNPEVGEKYKKLILKPGGSVDADVLLKNFLGREPNSDAFFASKGIK